MRRFHTTHLPILLLASAMAVLGADVAGAPKAKVHGTLRWPGTCSIFGPIKNTDPPAPQDTLATLPEVLHIGDHPLNPRVVELAKDRIDFRKVFDGFGVEDVAYVFFELQSPTDQNVLLGFGADWWLQAWVDGKLVLDTTTHGNIEWPPSITNFVRSVRLSKGRHVLAIRFISGKGSSVLTVGGPAELRAVPKLAWKPVTPPEPEPLGLEAFPSGGFEKWTTQTPPVPRGWENGQGACAFIDGELSPNREAPLSGTTSIEINSLRSGAHRRRIATRLNILPGQLYRVAFKARWLAGGYATVSVRETPSSCRTSLLAGGMISQKRQGDIVGYYYFEQPRPYLVIEAYVPVHLLIDEISFRPTTDESKKWKSYNLQRAPWGPEWYSISQSVETPHSKIVTQTPLGLSLLSIMPRWHHRWTLELVQRLGGPPFRTIMFARPFKMGNPFWVCAEDGPRLFDVAADAIEKATEHAKLGAKGAVLIHHISPSTISEELAKSVMDGVRSGNGLVITGFDHPFYPYPDGRDPKKVMDRFKVGPWAAGLCDANRVAAPTDVLTVHEVASTSIECFGHGDGRILLLRSAEIIGEDSQAFEAKAALICKTLLWAGGRVDQVPSPAPSATQKEQGRPAIKAIKLAPRPGPYYTRGDTIRGAVDLEHALEPGVELWVALSDTEGRCWQRRKCGGAGASLSFEFATDMLRVLVHKITACLERPGVGGAVRTIEVVVVPSNRHHREMFDFQIWQAPRRYTGFLADRVLREQFRITSVIYPSSVPVDAARNCALNNIRIVTAAGTSYPGRSNKVGGDPHAPVRKLCLSSKTCEGNLAWRMRTYDARGVQYGPMAYITDHEQNLRGLGGRLTGDADVCFSPSCLASLRRFLKAEYADIAQLNESWGTRFTDWGDVTPIVLAEAIETGQISRWVDHRRHMDRVWTDFTLKKQAAMRKHDPKALLIADNLRSGPTTCDSFNGVDYWLLMSEAIAGAALVQPYLASFVPSEREHLVWERGAGWHPDVWTAYPELFRTRFANKPWQALLNGASGYTYWAYLWGAFPDGNFMNPLMMDLTVTDFGRLPADAVARIREGLFTFVRSATFDHSGIALHYSRASEHLCAAWQRLHPGTIADEFDPRSSQFSFFAAALQSVRRQFKSLAYGQVEQGALNSDDLKLLILPFSQCLSPNEARVVRQFVADGGTVLADVRPAVADQHGRMGETGLLDDVFGIRQQTEIGAYVPEKGAVQISGTVGRGVVKVTLGSVILGPNLELRGARALGRRGATPVCVLHHFGKGRAILLNFSMRSLGRHREAVDVLFDAILESCDIPPLFGLSASDAHWRTAGGERVKLKEEDFIAAVSVPGAGLGADAGIAEEVGIEMPLNPAPTVVRWVSREIEVIGFWYRTCRGDGQQRVVVTPRRPGWTYDLKAGRCLGRVDRIERAMPLEGLAAYAIVPYQIERPVLQARVEQDPEGRPVLVCKGETKPVDAKRQRHAMRFRVHDPNGAEWKDFAVSAIARDGVCEIRVVLPLNAPSGAWRVTATEAISRLQAETEVKLAVAEGPGNSPLRRAPQVREASGALLEPQLLCRPKFALFVGWTRQIQQLNDNRTVVVSSPGEHGGSYLYLIDSDDLTVQRFSIPKHHGSASNAVVGPDGHLYLPPHTDGCVYKFDVNTHALTRFDVGYPKNEMTWGSVAAKNGRIYFGSYPTATLGEFDPATGKCEFWQHTFPDARYATYFSEDRDGRIHFLACHPKQQWMQFDPATRKLEHGKRVGTPAKLCGPPFGLPKPPEGDSKFSRCFRTHGRFFGITYPTGRFWEIVLDKDEAGNGSPRAILRGETNWPVEKWKLVDAGDVVVGVSDYGQLLRFDLRTGGFAVGHLPNHTETPSHVMYLETISPRCVVLSPGIHKGFVKLDPDTGAFEQIYNMFHDRAVQGQCAVAANGKLYMGLYGGAVLMRYDPSKPYEWVKNPRELIALSDKHAQTRPRQAITDGRRVFFCTDGGYGVLGGALAVIDTETDAIQVYKHPVKDQNMPAIALDPVTGLLWGGTWRWGTSRSCPPIQPSSLLYAFDLTAGEVVHEQVLWPGSDNTYVAGISETGVLVASNGARIALVDTATRKVLYQGKMAAPAPTRLRRGSDGLFYYIRDKRLWRWDLASNVITPVADAGACGLLTEARPGRWVLAGTEGIFRLDVRSE